MFLKYLSNQEYDKRYWPFVFRFETILYGVVIEVSKHIDNMSDEQAKDFFLNIFANVLDENSGITPSGWWQKIESPPFHWYCEYIERETPYMLRESRRLAHERQKCSLTDNDITKQDSFDRERIHDCAHTSNVFRDFLQSR